MSPPLLDEMLSPLCPLRKKDFHLMGLEFDIVAHYNIRCCSGIRISAFSRQKGCS